MINCSVCFENKPLSEMKLNKNCGHACLCKECFGFYINTIIELNETSTVYNNNNNNALNCPICREYGEYTNIYTTNASDNSYNSESEDDELNINKGVLNKLLEYGLSQYYEITTKRDNLCFYLKDNNIKRSNIIAAYYGTEYSTIDGNPIFIDVLERINMALILNKSYVYVEAKNLVHNKYIKRESDEVWYLYIVTKIE